MLLVRGCGLRGIGVPLLGLPCGTALHTGYCLLYLLLGLPSHPALALTSAWVTGAAVWFFYDKKLATRREWLGSIALILSLAVLVAGAREANAFTWHSDSVRLIQGANLVAADHYDWMSEDILSKRMASFPMLHAPAHLMNEHFLRSLAPALAIASLGAVVWFTYQNLRTHSALNKRLQLALATVIGLVLLTNSRFLFNAIYVNAHLLCASYLLLVSAGGWLKINTGRISSQAMIVLQSLGAAGLVLVRAEGPLMATIALIPFACCHRLNRRERTIPLFTLGLVTSAWHGYIFLSLQPHERPTSSLALAVLGLALVAIGSILTKAWFQAINRHALHLTEGLIWLTLGALSLRKPDILVTSVIAMVDNSFVGNAGWGSSLSVLWLLAIALLVFCRCENREFLRFPVTTFIPLSLLFAFLRQEAYRMAWQDSFTRAFMHILPVLLLLVGTSFVSQWRKLGQGHGETPERPAVG